MPRWPVREAYFWEEAPLLRPLLLLVAGIICYDGGFPGSPFLLPALIILLSSGALTVIACFMSPGPAAAVLQAVLFPLYFILLGWCSGALCDDTIRTGYFAGGAPGAIDAVRIISEPMHRGRTIRMDVELIYRINARSARPVSGRARLYVYYGERQPIDKGDTLLVPAGWQPVRNSGNPFEFDYARLQQRRGIMYQLFLRPEQVNAIGHAAICQKGLLEQAHDWCGRALRRNIRHPDARGLLEAMLLGDESGFDPVLRQAYSMTGVIHIVSISGSHVAVLFLIVTRLTARLRGRRAAVIRYGAGLILVWLYVLIAGAPPSALRSAIMFSVMAFGAVTGRKGHSLNTLAAAALVLLLLEPPWLFSVGFQLSFGAVLSMLLFYAPIYRVWPQHSRAGRWLWQAASASISAELLTAPLVIYYFHNFPALFIVANLLAMTLAGGCCLVGGMAVIALSPLSSIAMLIGNVVSWLLLLFNRMILWLQQYNPDSFRYLQISTPELLSLYLLVTTLAMWLIRQNRLLGPLALAVTCFLLGLLCIDRYRALQQDRLVVYSHGREPLVERIRGTRHFTLIGDGGSYPTAGAHTGWQAWQAGPAGVNCPLLCIRGRRVLLLSDTAINRYTVPLQTDILIICRPLRRLEPRSVMRSFCPKTLVIARLAPDFQLKRWADSCRTYGVHLHNVATSGAYIIE